MKIISDLLLAQKLIYEPAGCCITNLKQEPESSEYGAYTFELNGRLVIFRVAKITPKKLGQFVTLWKRIGSGPIMPYDITDPFEFFIISTRKGDSVGQFIFPKRVLYENEIISQNGDGGKRAMRIYPPWEKPQSTQAQKTQRWQLPYFLEIDSSTPEVLEFFEKLIKDSAA